MENRQFENSVRELEEINERLEVKALEIASRYGEGRIAEILGLEKGFLQDWVKGVTTTSFLQYDRFLKNDALTQVMLVAALPEMTLAIHSALCNVFLLGYDACAREYLARMQVTPDHDFGHSD